MVEKHPPRFGLVAEGTHGGYDVFARSEFVETLCPSFVAEREAHNVSFGTFVLHQDSCALVMEKEAIFVSEAKLGWYPAEPTAGN